MFGNSRKSKQVDGQVRWQKVKRRKIERNIDEKNEKKLERNKGFKKEEEEKKQFRAANERARGRSG